MVVSTQTASVSMIQRRLRVGYTRAGRLIDMLERRGVISGYEGSKPRQVLVSEGEPPRVLERLDSPHEDRSPSRSPLERAPAQSRSEFLKIAVAHGDSAGSDDPLQIGAILEDARTRQGIDIETLRSGRRFARSICARSRTRTGRGYLGLRGARVHSRLRRRGRNRLGGARRRVPAAPRSADAPLCTPSPCCVGVEERARRRPLPRRLILGAIVAEVAILLLILGLTAGDDDDGASGRQGASQERQRDKPGATRKVGAAGWWRRQARRAAAQGRNDEARDPIRSPGVRRRRRWARPGSRPASHGRD